MFKFLRESIIKKKNETNQFISFPRKIKKKLVLTALTTTSTISTSSITSTINELSNHFDNKSVYKIIPNCLIFFHKVTFAFIFHIISFPLKNVLKLQTQSILCTK